MIKWDFNLEKQTAALIHWKSDQSPNMYFTDTYCDYRDDNRHLWIYIEESDDEHMFEQEEQKLIELHYAYQHVSQLNAPRLS